MNIGAQISLKSCFQFFLSIESEMELLGHVANFFFSGNSIFNSLSNQHTAFHSRYIIFILHFYQQHTRVLIFVHLCRYLLFFFFFLVLRMEPQGLEHTRQALPQSFTLRPSLTFCCILLFRNLKDF